MTEALTAPTKPKRPPAKYRSDSEFLAPAIEIIETPPSPVHIYFLWFICALFVVAAVFSYFGRIDIIATAQGKLQPVGRVKVIEPVETGRVAAIRVSDGADVEEGEALVELDRTSTEADARAAESERNSARAEALRRRAAFDAAQARQFTPPPALAWPDDIDANLREREERVLNADLAQLDATLTSLDSQFAQKTAERDQLTRTVETQKTLIATLQERVDMRATLLKSSSGTKSSVIDATEALNQQQTQLSIQQTELTRAAGALVIIRRAYDKEIQTFLAAQAQKLDDAERAATDAGERLAKARARTDNLTLRSPIAGRVQSSVITNKGQVLASGQEVMRIVPHSPKLVIVSYVLNRDIGFITVGQEAVVKVESFPYTRYGGVTAHVVRIARDAIPAPDASLLEGDPTHSTRALGYAGAERLQNLVFAVELETTTPSMLIDGVYQPLTSGMAVTVEFKTGVRRLIEYVFAPLMETTSRAMRER
jgi:hemolysin D